MTKRELRKTAYRLIIKEGKSHQLAYNEMRVNTSTDTNLLANEVAKVPSKHRRAQYQVLNFVYIAMLGLVIILKILGALALMAYDNFNPQVVLIVILLGVAFPIYGIYGALTARNEAYASMAFILGINIIRSFTSGTGLTDPYLLIAIIPFFVGLILAIVLSQKLKSKFTKTVEKKEVDGKMKSIYKVTFEKDLAPQDGLLDCDLS